MVLLAQEVNMKTIESLYTLLDVPPTCSDDEFRQAYFHALLKHQPDKEHFGIQEKIDKTQEIVLAYTKLQEYRREEHDESDLQSIIDDEEFTTDYSFESRINLDDIAERKSTFRQNWGKFKENPSDTIGALRLINSAFRAGQLNAIEDLLINPILIDSATQLLSFLDEENAGNIYLEWAKFLREKSRSKESFQILEIALPLGLKWPAITEELRTLHYSWAQYVDPTTGIKTTPLVRIKHFNQIIKLGFKYDYIYKFLAEAYFELGDIEQARDHLKQAYLVNPDLAGAIKISRALGFLQTEPSKSDKKSSSQYKWSHPHQVLTATQIYEWAQTENWSALIEYADPNQYSPRILSKARKAFDQIADSLGKYNDPKSAEALIRLISASCYWDVNITAINALSKVGDEKSYNFLAQQTPTNDYGKIHLRICLSYLKARFDKELLSYLATASKDDLLAQAKKNYRGKKYGRTRVILEYLLNIAEPTFSAYYEIKILLALCCAKMSDVNSSIELILPIVSKLPKELRNEISPDLSSWIYNILMSHGYYSIKDGQYQLGLEILLEGSIKTKNPSLILDNLYTITRWLELLGVSDLTQWIRQLIGIEAPGTGYVDAHNRINYIQEVDLSENMKDFLMSFDNQIKIIVAPKLKELI